MKFSERIGAAPSLQTIQLEEMNESLRNSLWNVLNLTYGKTGHELWSLLCRASFLHFFKLPIDDVPKYEHRCQEWLRFRFYEMQWFQVYDYLEFLVKISRPVFEYKVKPGELASLFNHYLEREMSGYRFIDGLLAPISNSEETCAVLEAIEESSRSGLQGAATHIKSALQLLSLKPQPDFRNSIKESISAVESVAKQLTGSECSGLAPALNALEQIAPMHGALKSAFVKLYGYTSDEHGIRHAMLEDGQVGFDEAKYMLVSCSAFVNYLVMRGARAGLLARSS